MSNAASDSTQGSIEVYGTPFSTFTRSITMGLHELGHSSFKQHDLMPHDAKIEALNPFGLLPVFIHTPSDSSSSAEPLKLFETLAIKRYIDGTFATSSRTLMPASPSQAARVEQWVALAATQLFPAAELGVIKPRLAAEEKGESEDKITKQLAEGVDKLREVLGKLEKLVGDDEWLAGSSFTWADTFAYPPLADLRAIPEGEALLGASSSFPRLKRWLEATEKRDSAKQTRAGTLADQRSS